MEFKIPDSDRELILLKSKDDLDQLIKMYNLLYNTINGKTVSDIALVYEQITELESIERVDLVIPYTFGHKRNEPKGHRIWYLSQSTRTSKYYNGNYFDIEVVKGTKRKIRKRCRLSNSAIQLFQKYPAIKNNQRIEENA